MSPELYEELQGWPFNERVEVLKRLSKKQLKDLFDRFTANFTYESNAIEGNSLTLNDVAIVAYEPTFAIGTGNPDTLTNIKNVIQKISGNNYICKQSGI